MAKLETRKRILTAAQKLFSENGYDGVPTKLIASEAGVTEMTLFNHFTNKELLYKSIVKERYLAMDITEVYDKLSYDDFKKDLLIVVDKLIENYFKNRQLLKMRLKERESFHDDETFKIEKDPMIGQLKPLFKSYKEKKTIKSDEDKDIMTMLAAIKGIFYVSVVEDKSYMAVEELIHRFVDVFCYGFVVDGSDN